MGGGEIGFRMLQTEFAPLITTTTTSSSSSKLLDRDAQSDTKTTGKGFRGGRETSRRQFLRNASSWKGIEYRVLGTEYRVLGTEYRVLE